MKSFFAVLGFSLLMMACETAKKSTKDNQMKQGIRGYVKEFTGNQMPSPDVPPSPGKPVRTTVYVYAVTHLSQVDQVGSSPFYTAIRSQLIQTVESDKSGYFSLELPAGNYSLFTKVDGKFYANSFDGKNQIAPVTVEENKVSEVNITISAKAVY